MKYFLPIIVLIFAVNCRAATYNAATCSEANVQSAYTTEQASKVDGDIINIPSCATTTWSSAWSISPTNSIVFQGQSTTTGTCAPGGTCTATDNTNITLGSSATLSWTTPSGKSLRVTGISFTVSLSGAQNGAINFSGNSTAVRVDHNHINDLTGGDHTLQIDNINGVFDHNVFDSTNNSDVFFFQVTVCGANCYGNETWTAVENFGSSQFVFFENNLFQNGWFMEDCDFGGRFVARYNIVGSNTAMQTHGVGSGQERRGCRAWETYENSFAFSTAPDGNANCGHSNGPGSNCYFGMLQDYESGPAMFWGNTVSGFQTMLREQEVRADNATYAQTATPNGWGYCGTAFNGTHSNWDQNSNGASGYACMDQVGRGAGQLVVGNDFPNFTNQSTGTIAWLNQTLVPTYAWGNTFNTFTNVGNDGGLHYWSTYESPVRVTENTDYYLQLPNANEASAFTGIAGVGCGPSTGVGCPANALARPATCTAGVGYWNESTQTFYVCAAGNAWNVAYTPYTYPHPLTGSASPNLTGTQFSSGVTLGGGATIK